MINYPLGTESKLNVHKTFRRHPERLLNVLYMVSLRFCAQGVVISWFLLLMIANVFHFLHTMLPFHSPKS